MSNLAGGLKLGYNAPAQPSPTSVEEWASRTGAQLPGELDMPRGTLRGHPQPWRTRPSACLTDTGPLHQSCYLGHNTSQLHQAPPAPGNGKTSSTGPSWTPGLDRNDWETRLVDGSCTIKGGLRGSLAPNWKPLHQEDLTGTGSVNIPAWAPGTSLYNTPGSKTMRQVLAAATPTKPETTWSTGSPYRSEWETRLVQQSTSHA